MSSTAKADVPNTFFYEPRRHIAAKPQIFEPQKAQKSHNRLLFSFVSFVVQKNV